MEFLRPAKILSQVTLLSRVLGLARDMLTTAVLQAALCDSLYMAWTLPNLFRNLFGEGALSSAFIPVFSRVLHAEGRDRAFLLARRLTTVIGLVLFALVFLLLGATFLLPMEWFSALLGVEPDKAEHTIILMRILLPYLVVICVIAQFQGVLNTLREFFLPALSPCVLNAAWIAAALAAGWAALDGQPERARIIAWGIMAGAFFQVLLFTAALRKHGVPLSPAWGAGDPHLKRVLVTMLPMMLGVSAVQVNVLVDRWVAYAFIPGDGGVSHLFIGNRMMQLPFALIGIALTTAVFPLLARLSASGDRKGMIQNLTGALRISFFLSVPAAVGLALLAHPIIALFFERGEFTPERVQATAAALLGYAAGIPFLISVMLLARAFYAMEAWREPLVVSACLVAVNIVLDLVLVERFAEAGISGATSIAAILQALALGMLLRRKIGLLGGKMLLKGIFRTLLLTALLAAAVWGVLQGLGPAHPEHSTWIRTIRVFLPLFSGMAVYLLLAWKFCPLEWSALIGAIRRK